MGFRPDVDDDDDDDDDDDEMEEEEEEDDDEEEEEEDRITIWGFIKFFESAFRLFTYILTLQRALGLIKKRTHIGVGEKMLRFPCSAV